MKNKKKLEKLAECNNIKHDFAHDAMSDVDATLGLAEIIKNNDIELWKHVIEFRNHSTVNSFIEKNKVCILPPVNASSCYTPVCYLTRNPDNQKELIFFILNEEVTEEIISSLNRRLILPFYIPVIALLCSMLLIKSKKKLLNKNIIFIYSFILLVFIELIVRYTGLNYFLRYLFCFFL